MQSAVSRPVTVARALASFVLSAALPAVGQQPRQDDRQAVPTPGVTVAETPGASRTAPAPDRTPRTTTTPAPEASGSADSGVPGGSGGTRAGTVGRGPGRPPVAGHPATARREAASDINASDPRTAGTWAIFGALVVALGLVTIRMLRRPGFGPGAPLDTSAADEPPLDSRA
jgi:hypothetical protein